MPAHVGIQGLAERREQRIRERRQDKGRKVRIPKSDREYWRAVVFFATCPRSTLIAAHQAVLKTLKQKSDE